MAVATAIEAEPEAVTEIEAARWAGAPETDRLSAIRAPDEAWDRAVPDRAVSHRATPVRAAAKMTRDRTVPNRAVSHRATPVRAVADRAVAEISLIAGGIFRRRGLQ